MARIRTSFDISFKIRVCEAVDRGEYAVLEPKKIETSESAEICEVKKLKVKVDELTLRIEGF